MKFKRLNIFFPIPNMLFKSVETPYNQDLFQVQVVPKYINEILYS